MTLYRLYLTDSERKTLESWKRKLKSESLKLQKIQILLNSDENVVRRSSTELKAILGISIKTIERVRRQFCEEGLSMFEPKLRKTRCDKKIDARVEAHLTTLMCQSPPDEKKKWELKMLADRLIELKVVEHISTTMVSRLLKKTN